MWAFISGLAAAVAVLVAYLQWRTAQTKVALDVYATRYAIYKDLREAVSNFVRELNFSQEIQAQYMDAQSRARFHFGAEVEHYLESLRREMIRGHMFYRYGHVRQQLGGVDEQVARLDRVSAFYDEIDQMFVPYMRLDQRMPLWWWPPFTTRLKDASSRVRARLKRQIYR